MSVRIEKDTMGEVEVPAETSAVVMSEPLRRGAHVEKGQELCVLDPGTRHVTLADARAQLSLAQSRIPESEARRIEAEAVLEQARIDLNAAEKLPEGGYASDIRLAGARATIRSAEAAIAAAAKQVASAADCDAIVISCTNLRCLRVIPGIEAQTGVPVISSNQALAWHMLRLAGVTESQPQFGRLFTQALAAG